MKKDRKLELVEKLVYWSDDILRLGSGNSTTVDRIKADDITDIISILLGNNTSIKDVKKRQGH